MYVEGITFVCVYTYNRSNLGLSGIRYECLTHVESVCLFLVTLLRHMNHQLAILSIFWNLVISRQDWLLNGILFTLSWTYLFWVNFHWSDDIIKSWLRNHCPLKFYKNEVLHQDLIYIFQLTKFLFCMCLEGCLTMTLLHICKTY